jgi:hypothetical protein
MSDITAAATAEQRLLAEHYILIALAGIEAERTCTCTTPSIGHAFDLSEARAVALAVSDGDPVEADAHLAWLRTRTVRLLARPDVSRAVGALTQALSSHDVLSFASCRRVVISAKHARSS